MEDQRLTKRLLNHWNLIRKDAAFPAIEQLNKAAIEDLWPKCFLLSLQRDNQSMYRYDYMGQTLIDIYGRDLTGSHLNEKMKQFPGSVVFGKLSDIVASPRPIEDEGYFVNRAGKLVKYRACFLPFGKDGAVLTHIAVGLSSRLF